MKKIYHYFSLVLLLSIAANVWGQEVKSKGVTYITQEEGKSIARDFFRKSNIKGTPVLANYDINVYQTRGGETSTIVPFYIYNAENGNAFVIVDNHKGSNRIIGYCKGCSFNKETIPEGLKELLFGYIANHQSIDSEKLSVRSHVRKSVSPLIKTKWGQGYPYNASCPISPNNRKCVTGCLATAMAQILYYYYCKEPSKITKELPLTIPSYYYNGMIEGVTKGTPIHWEYMTETYDENSSEYSKEAVSDLMYICGTSTKMNYNDEFAGGSTAHLHSGDAYTSDGLPFPVGADFALNKYFNISSRYIKYNNTISSEEWANNIYNELINSRPVLYTGYNTKQIGHASIIDGCDDFGLFHINWGWDGLYDGYYNIEATTNEYEYLSSPVMLYKIMPKDEDVDGISDMTIKKSTSDNKVYSLTGCKLQAPNRLKGVYIINKNKVIYK
jgi:hypothetical protein